MLLKYYIYYSLLSLASAAALVRWKTLSSADRILALLIWLTLAAEVAALYTIYRWRNSVAVYHLFNPLQLLLLSLYFNYSIRVFRKLHIGWVLGIGGPALELLSSSFRHPSATDNLNILLVNAVLIIICSLFAIYQVLMDERRDARQFVLFWVSLAQLLFWSATFTGWALYPPAGSETLPFIRLFSILLAGANFALYLPIALVFVRYPRLIPSTTHA